MKPAYTVLFEHAIPGLIEHIQPLVQAWIDNGHHALIMAPETALTDIQAAYHRSMVSNRITFGSFEKDIIPWHNLNAMVYVTRGEPGPAFKHPQTRLDIPRVTLNHGLTDKATTFPADFLGHGIGYNNVLFASGPAMFKGSWESYVRKWPETPASLKIIPMGAPKTDSLFDASFHRQSILETLALDPQLPTVLYAPTHQPEASLEQAGEIIIRTLCSLTANVLVRLHHLSVNPLHTHTRERSRNWPSILHQLAKIHPNLRLVSGNSNPYYVAADLMVGDVSGACYEFILQDKPVIFYDVPKFFTIHGQQGIAYWGRHAGIVVNNPETLRQGVMTELKEPTRLSSHRQHLISQLVYQRGNACKRAVMALQDLIEGRVDYPTWGPRQNIRLDTLLHAFIRERLARCAGETNAIAIFGAGAHTPRLLNWMADAAHAGYPMPVISVILDDSATPNTPPLQGIPVRRPDEKQLPGFDAIILSSDYHQAIMAQRCRDLFGTNMMVIDLYAEFPWHRPGPDANAWPIHPA